MAKKLQPDVIEWILKLNSSQAQEEYHKLEKANRELKKENDATRKSMVELEKQGKKGSQEWKNLKNAISANNNVMADNRAKMEALSKQISNSDKTLAQLRKQLKDLKREFENTSKATSPDRYKELQKQIELTNKAIKNAQGETSKLGGVFKRLTMLKETVSGFFYAIGATIMANVVGAFKNAFSIIVDFERENSRLAAILGTTREGIADMTKAARQLGAITSYSAAEVTQLQIELAKLGFQRDQILAMEGAVLKFAKAVGTDLASASAFAGAALRIFGKDASETESVLASFAVATTKSALDFSKLETSLSIVGPVAAAAGFSLEDTTAILGLLANKGFDASSSATALRNTFLKLADGSSKLSKAMGRPIKNAEDLAGGLQRLVAAGVDLQMALELTDKRSVAAFEAIMESSGQLVELRDSITGVDEQFNAMADTMSDNVAGALAGLKSASEELILQISDGTGGPLKELINLLTDGVRKLQEVAKWLQENFWRIKPVVAAIISWKVAQLVLNGAQKIWNGLLAISNNLLGIFQKSSIRATQVQRIYSAALEEGKTKLQAFGLAMKSLPWVSIISGIVSVIAMLKTFSTVMKGAAASTDSMASAEKEAADRAREHRRKRDELNVSIETEKRRLLELHKIASDANSAEEDRKKAVEELKKVMPGYTDQLDKEGKALKANKKLMDEYILSLEKRMRLAYYKDEYQEYLKEEEKAKMDRVKAERFQKKWQEENPIPTDENGNPIYLDVRKRDGEWYSELKDYNDWYESEVERTRKLEQQAVENTKQFADDMKKVGIELSEVLGTSEETPVDTSGVVLPKKKEKKGREKDKIKLATAAIDAEHQQNLVRIEQMKESMTEAQYIIERNQEMIDYCGRLTEALSSLQAKTASTDTELLNKITERQGKIDQDAAKARQNVNAAIHQQEEDFHADFLAAKESFYQEQKRMMEEAVQKEEITRSAADVFLMNEEMAMHKEQLKRLRDYYDQVEQADYLSDEKRKERLKSLGAEIKTMQSQVLTDTGKFTAKLREMTENPVGLEAMKRNYETQRIEIAQMYEQMKRSFASDSDDYAKLESEKNRRLMVLDYQYKEDIYSLQEKIGLSWADEYDLELLRLKEMHAEGLITEEQYQAKRLELGVSKAKQYFDFYSGLATSMFQAMQDAEIAASEAKYDALIRQAENNGEETAQLEQEKENKKLEIQKKYADVNFAIKISQIIADTAVSIMKAFADLGPIGGAIAAAMLTAAGAAQIVSANAEREKIKNLQPKSASASGSVAGVPTATRTLSGFSEGGYTGDGNRYEVAGLVHKGEYVVPKPIMGHPRVVDAVGTIEAIRLNRMGNRSGFADGGFTSGSSNPGKAGFGIDSLWPTLLEELHSLCREMKTALRNVKAYVVLQELNRQQKILEQSQAKFKRK